MKYRQFITGTILGAAVVMTGSAFASGHTVTAIVSDMITFSIDGLDQESPDDALLFEDRTYVPLRFVAEQLGAKVDYDQKTKKIAMDSRLSTKMAEQLVAMLLKIPPNSDTIVEFDHTDDNGHYVIHVYNFVTLNSQTGEGFTATKGWYSVDPATCEVVQEL